MITRALCGALLVLALALGACGGDGGDGGGDGGTTEDVGGDGPADAMADAAGAPDAADVPAVADEDVAGPAPDVEEQVDAAPPVEDAGPPVEEVTDEADAAFDAAPDPDVEPDAPEPVDVEEDAGPAPLDPATLPLRGGCPDDERVGTFAIEVSDLFSFVQGEVVDGINPFQVQPIVSEEGDCRLRKVTYPFCDPLCQPGMTCDHDGTCVPYPLGQDAGVITVEGLLGEVVMEPKPPGNQYFNTSLPNPAFAPDSPIRLTSTPGYAGELTLYGVGHEPISQQTAQWVVEDDVPVALTWPAAPEGARTEVHVSLNIDQHGTSPVTVLCDFADSGAGEIPASVINELFAFGVSGFPNARLVRRTVDSQETSVGCVELETRSLFVPEIEVAGHTPCFSQADCPPGETCNLPIQTCE